MRFHTDYLSESDIRDALKSAKETGHVDKHVVFSELAKRGSRSRNCAFEIRLEWIGEKVKGDGRRHTNTGNNGADTGGSYAATYEEWGWFISELFEKDAFAIFGHYKSQHDFESATRYAFGN